MSPIDRQRLRARGLRAHAMRPRVVGAVAAATAVLVFASGCSGSSGSSDSSGSPASSGNSDASTDGTNVTAPILAGVSAAEASRVSALIAEAAKEGSLNWVDSVPAPATATALTDAFKKAYNLPNITIKYTRSSTAAIGATLQQQVQAGKVDTDIFGVGDPILFPELKKANALENYSSPELSAYAKLKADFPNDDGYWVTPDAYSYNPVANVKLYSTPITSWQDLLSPALAGKLNVPDVPSYPSQEYWYLGLKTKMPDSFFTQLAATHPGTSNGSSILEATNLAQGKVAVTIMPGFRASQAAKDSGATLQVYYPTEGSVYFGQTYALMANSPHPALAKLFEDFLLSAAGQTQYVSLEGLNSTRDDVPMPANFAQYSRAISDVSVIQLPWDSITQADLTNVGKSWAAIFHK